MWLMEELTCCIKLVLGFYDFTALMGQIPNKSSPYVLNISFTNIWKTNSACIVTTHFVSNYRFIGYFFRKGIYPAFIESNNSVQDSLGLPFYNKKTQLQDIACKHSKARAHTKDTKSTKKSLQLVAILFLPERSPSIPLLVLPNLRS